MKTGIGLPVFSGVSIGPAVVYRKSERTLPVSSGDPAIEQAKFDAAVITAREQLSALYEKAKVELGEEKAAIVEVQMLMPDDLDYLDGVTAAIEDGAAAALAALAKEAAFFSVGTNDLTQYTLAVDRQNAKLDKFYDPYHPALMALLAHIAKSANEAGIWAGICGELGADPTMIEKFIEMGYTELSMAAGRILEARKIVCESEL